MDPAMAAPVPSTTEKSLGTKDSWMFFATLSSALYFSCWLLRFLMSSMYVPMSSFIFDRDLARYPISFSASEKRAHVAAKSEADSS